MYSFGEAVLTPKWNSLVWLHGFIIKIACEFITEYFDNNFVTLYRNNLGLFGLAMSPRSTSYESKKYQP